MIGRLFFLLLVIVFLALAVMFDWFGLRDGVHQGLDKTQQAVESLSNTGDRIQQTFESKQ